MPLSNPKASANRMLVRLHNPVQEPVHIGGEFATTVNFLKLTDFA